MLCTNMIRSRHVWDLSIGEVDVLCGAGILSLTPQYSVRVQIDRLEPYLLI